MRTFLYLSPYFPPDARVGALRPLKFVRHLPAQGFRPVVLADAPAGARDDRLLGVIPPEVVIVRDYGRRSGRRWRRRGPSAETSPPPWLGALESPLGRRLATPFEQPELVPLGPHALDVPHALRAARRLLELHGCEAILVNADPFASAVVGALLSRISGVPLVVDFRDPWALCSLRRPLRKPWVARSVDALERFVIETARRVILNTESARLAYARHYAELGDERFACIPNHADPSLGRAPAAPALGEHRFELLLAGTLRRFVDGAILLEIVTELARRGVGPERFGVTIAGRGDESFLGRVLALGLGPYFSLEPPLSYLDVPARQQRADLLFILGHRDRQRIPAKIYDAALSDRPLLVVSENPELAALSSSLGGARVFGHDQAPAIAEWIEELIALGSGPPIERRFEWTSAAATARLAEILHQSCQRSAA